MELAVVGSTKTLSVSDAVFGREFSEDLVHQVVVAYRNAGRAGTKAQLTRSEVRGTTKKFKKTSEHLKPNLKNSPSAIFLRNFKAGSKSKSFLMNKSSIFFII